MTDKHLDPFDGLKPTEAPSCLKVRVLQAARNAEGIVLPHRTLVDSAWESRWVRPVWAAAVAVLVAVNIHLAAPPTAVAHSPRSVGTYLLTGRLQPEPPALRGRNVISLAHTGPLLQMLLDQDQPDSVVNAPRAERKGGA